MANISKLIAEKKGYTKLLNELVENFSGSDLNSLLLELFKRRADKIGASQLPGYFEKSRYVTPSTVDAIDFNEFELKCLKLAKNSGFLPITLSPLTILGTCSAMGFVDQNNVMTSLRGTEVVADATNVLALLIADEYKKKKNVSITKYATAHRHVRTQTFSNPGFTPHFSIFCLATGGVDTGNYSFELTQLVDHVSAHLAILSSEFKNDKFLVKIYLKQENELLQQKIHECLGDIGDAVNVSIERESNPGGYYQLVQFKFFLLRNGKEINLSDGGFVDWTQKIIPNKKHRLIISGIGTELIYKIKHEQL